MMGASTPHIYLSSLAFIPSSSPLHDRYLKHCPGVVKFVPDLSSPVRWLLVLLEMRESSPVLSTKYSPDGKYIVSGSHDSTIHVWDAQTGRLVASPSEGHTYAVRSVRFSSDGKFIVSGSYDRAIRVWDAHTTRLVTGPLQGHTHAVLSVGFSPNGKFIVSGSLDSTI
jgi:WD40 repeat protein